MVFLNSKWDADMAESEKAPGKQRFDAVFKRTEHYTVVEEIYATSLQEAKEIAEEMHTSGEICFDDDDFTDSDEFLSEVY